jgi:heparinase II/III-like protein
LRRISRRRIAPLIRVRQEIEKRLDPVLPWRAGPDSIDRLVVPRVSRELAEDGDALRRVFARGAATRFPLTHLAARSPAELPARAQLDASIGDAARGAWYAFGSPVRVNFRSHDWTRHPVSGARSGNEHWSRVAYMGGVGGGDVKVIWELSRHHHLVRLAQGYFLDRDESKVESLLVLLDEWIEQNPHGRGINWTSSLEIAFRAIAWCWIWALTCDSPAWTTRRTTRFLVSLWHHARHVERFDSIHHSPNTHLTGEALGLLYVGLMFPELSRSRLWADRGRDILESELWEQVLDDGMHFERATGYHRYTAEFYLHFLVLADAFGIDVSSESRARVLAQVRAAAILRRPDGTWPVIGDEDSGDTLLLSTSVPQDQGPVLAVGGALFRDASLVALTSNEHRSAGWWLLGDDAWRFLRDTGPSSSSDVAPNVSRSEALPAAGYFMGRDVGATDDWWCLVDAGAHGGDETGHAHTDLGHVEIAHGASHLVVDPGCVAYTIDLGARDTARSETVHACLVTSEPLALPSGPFSWSRVSPTPAARHGDDGPIWWCELSYAREHDRARLTHRRQVVLVRGHGIVVCDWVEGASPISFAAHWPLGEELGAGELTESSLTTDAHSIGWHADNGSAHVRASLEPLRRSPGYGRECDGRLLRVAYAGKSPASLVTCFSDARRPLRVHAHDGSSARVVIDDLADGTRELMMAAGTPPTIRRARAPITPSRVIG